MEFLEVELNILCGFAPLRCIVPMSFGKKESFFSGLMEERLT